jgi:methionyl-tRNA formyltransferase
MRIIFIGSVFFSRIILEKLIDLNADVIGVITKSESEFNNDFEDLEPIAKKNNIPCRYVHDINDPASIDWIKQLKPDIIFCFGWSNLIKKEILNSCPMGVVGFHPALLPLNRGRHPLIWAKVLGLKKSGTSFFFMDEGADSGDILDQKEFEILFEDDASTLYKKMTVNALHQVESFLPKLKQGSFSRLKQLTGGNTWRKRNVSDGLIDFRMNTESICNLVRGLSKPYAGAHCILKGEEVKVWEVEFANSDEINLEPGKVLEIIGDGIKIKTADGAVVINKHSFLVLPEIGTYIR